LSLGNFFHPLDDRSIQRLLDGDMNHGTRWPGPMPVLFFRLERHDVARTDSLWRLAPALHQPGTGHDDQRLPERMRVPESSRARFEINGKGAYARGLLPLFQRRLQYASGEIFR